MSFLLSRLMSRAGAELCSRLRREAKARGVVYLPGCQCSKCSPRCLFGQRVRMLSLTDGELFDAAFPTQALGVLTDMGGVGGAVN